MWAFKDFLKPGWQHSEANVRKEAVKKLKDQAVLAGIARTDTHKEVRKEAVKRITDFAVLAEIARKDKEIEVRIEVLDSLKNCEDEIHSRIPIMDRDKVMEELVRLQNNEKELLLEMAKTDQDEAVRIKAMGNIWDKHLLAKIAATSPYKNTQIEAVKRIADIKFGGLSDSGIQGILIQITKTDVENDIRQEAVRHLKDTGILKEIAKTFSNSAIQIEAVKRIADTDPGLMSDCDIQDILIGIARTNVDSNLRKESVRLLKDNATLAELARSDTDKEVRAEAVKGIRDEKILTEIARNDESKCVRGQAIRKLTNKDLLAEFVRFGQDIDFAADAYIRLPESHPVHREALATTNLNTRWLDLFIFICENDNNYKHLTTASNTLVLLLSKFGLAIDNEHLTKMMNLKDGKYSILYQSDYSWDNGRWDDAIFSMEEVRNKALLVIRQ